MPHIEDLESIVVSMREHIFQLTSKLDVLEKGLLELKSEKNEQDNKQEKQQEDNQEQEDKQDEEDEESEEVLNISQKPNMNKPVSTEVVPKKTIIRKKSAVDIAMEKGKNMTKNDPFKFEDTQDESDTDLDEEETEPQIPTQTSEIMGNNNNDDYQSEVVAKIKKLQKAKTPTETPIATETNISSASSSKRTAKDSGGTNLIDTIATTASVANGMKARLALKRSARASGASSLGQVEKNTSTSSSTSSSSLSSSNEDQVTEEPTKKKPRKSSNKKTTSTSNSSNSTSSSSHATLPTIMDEVTIDTDDTNWSCSRCTYVNNDQDKTCTLCNTARLAISLRPTRTRK